MASGMRSPGGGRKSNNTGDQVSSVTRAVSPPDELLGRLRWMLEENVQTADQSRHIRDAGLLLSLALLQHGSTSD